MPLILPKCLNAKSMTSPSNWAITPTPSSSIVFSASIKGFKYSLIFQILNKSVQIELRNFDTQEIFHGSLKFQDYSCAYYCLSALTLNILQFHQKTTTKQTLHDSHNQWVTKIEDIETNPTLLYMQTGVFALNKLVKLNPSPDQIEEKNLVETPLKSKDFLKSKFKTRKSSNLVIQKIPLIRSSHSSTPLSPRAREAVRKKSYPETSLHQLESILSLKLELPLVCSKSTQETDSCMFIQHLSDQYLVAVTRDSELNAHCLLLDASTLKPAKKLRILPNFHSFSLGKIIDLCVLSNDKKLYILDNLQSTISIYDPLTGKCLISNKISTERNVYSLAISNDCKLIAVGMRFGLIHILDSNLRKLSAIQFGSQDWIWSLAFSDDDTILYSGDNTGKLRASQISSTQCLFQHSIHKEAIFHINVVKNRLITSSSDKTLAIFNLEKEIVETVISGSFQDSIFKSILVDNKFLIASSRDTTVQIFESPFTEKPVETLHHFGPVNHCSFFNSSIYTASKNSFRKFSKKMNHS